MSIPNSFRLKIYIDIFSNYTGKHIRSLLTLFHVPVDEVCRKFEKKMHKVLENWKILGFLSFSVSI